MNGRNTKYAPGLSVLPQLKIKTNHHFDSVLFIFRQKDDKTTMRNNEA
jgi:hypothetical protein